MAVQHTQAVQQLSSAARRTESRPSVIGPISLDWPHLKGNHGNVFKWLLWTGCRLNEAAGMRAGEVTGPYWKATNSKKAADLDAFGNSVRKKERTPEERHAEVIMCLAGGMAEGKSLGEDIFDFSPPDPPSPKALAFATETGGQIAKAHHAGNATPLAVIWILLAIIAAS